MVGKPRTVGMVGWIGMLLASTAIAQTSAPAVVDLSATLARIADEKKVPAMVAVVVKGGRIVAEGAAGVRKKGDPTPVTIDDAFHIGSCGKAMTAALCGLLVEEGKLKWTSTIGDVFPEWKDQLHASWRDATLDQFLSHRSGAPKDLMQDGLWIKLVSFQGEPEAARQLLLEGATTRPTEMAAGEKFIYSNAGFAIAGHMAERVTGKPFEILIRERIFEPLGMKTFGFGSPGVAGRVDAPWGHSAITLPIEPGRWADNPTAIAPAGTMHFGIRDWAKFVASQWPSGDAVRLLKPETLSHLHTPQKYPDGAEYGGGWGIVNRLWSGGDGRVFTHSGTNTAWFAVVWVAPGKDLQILIAANRGGEISAKACDEVATALVLRFGLDKKDAPATQPAQGH